MIKELNKFIERPISFQKNFLENCVVYEKISAYYIHVKIVSRNLIKFYKSNNKEIDITDLILNKMWKTPIDDFTKMFLSSETFMEKSNGMTFSFFFFPCEKPINIKYNLDNGCGGKYRYILDNIKLEDGNIINLSYLKDFEEIDTLKLIRPIGICLGNLEIGENKKQIKDLLKKRDVAYVENFIKTKIDDSNICAEGGSENSEGFIFKYKDEIFQLIQFPQPLHSNSNKLALEIFTHNFVDFVSHNQFADSLSTNNYVSNVSNLFLKFYKWLKQNPDANLLSYYHIKDVDLEAPTFGWYPGTFYELIPNPTVREICQNNKLFDNIFKILLNGLQKEKKYNKNALIMTNNDIEIWNSVVKVFSIYNKPFKTFKNKSK